MKKRTLLILFFAIFTISSLSALVINTDKMKIRCSISSADGEWTFVNALVGTDNDFKNCIFAISSYKNYAPQLIYESPKKNDDLGVGNLCYSDKTQKLYFSVDTKTEINNYWLNYNNGFFICEKDPNGFYTAGTVKRYKNFLADDMNLSFRAFIKDPAIPDYTGFLNFLYSFADLGTSPIFYIQTDDGTYLYETQALKYLCCTNGKIDANKFYTFVEKNKENVRFPLWRFVMDKNLGLEAKITAVTQNGQRDFANSDFKFEKWCYFTRNDAGIWIVNEEGYQNHLYGKVYLFEDETGRICLNNKTSIKEIKTQTPSAKYKAGVPHEIWYNNSITPDGKNLIIADENGKGFWYYDFESKSEEYFESKAELEAARTKFQKQNSIKLAIKSNKIFLILIVAALLLIIFILLSLIILLFFKIKKSHENAKLQKSEQTKNRNKFIFQIQEKERAKISRDIHDSVVQDIRVIRLETENLKVNEQSKEKQIFIQNTATNCITKLRNICYNLQPAEIYTHSDGDSSKIELISIINTLSQQFISKTHIPCIVKVEDDFEYPVLQKEVTENLFRTIQEALNNIEKHSYATIVSIYFKTKLLENKKNLVVYISDDGVGCNLENIKKKNKEEHRGLQNMQDRMELIGGSIEIFSTPNEGMEIKLTLPLEK